ncbi:energy transducer TonB [Cytophaga aurantiaca]|uniref:energy transducer TonB n=1 Tax=Cytophaga aurantiaca TaxID=29530 RepID=UPI0012FBCC2F|nr:energy transducer TonB [Cytophaga aurantiaca]
MKNTFIHISTFLFVFTATCLVSVSQTKIDTIYIKYLSSTISTTKDSASYYRVRTSINGILKASDYDIEDGMKECSGYYKSFDPDVKNGYFIYYFNDSVISSEGNYAEDKMMGTWKEYYSSGELWYTKTFVNGITNGMLKSYYKTGEVKRIEQYKKGKRIKAQCYTRSGKDTAYYEVQILPAFPGGEKAKMDYFKKNIKYPEQAKINNIEGTVYVSYSVNKDGSISDVEVVKGKGVDPLLDQAALDCVRNMPNWTPGYNDGDPVKVRLTQRIKFTISPNGK